ncbi:MAG: hypothetical protein JNJ86_08755 [Chitinophagaceae bacterium]|nr:hypothetical protein [Chitinophagaceae bacterium]
MRTILIGLLGLCLAGCTTNSYFSSSNNLVNQDCSVHLTDGTVIIGKLSIQFESGQNSDKYVKLLGAENTERKILISDILYYQHKNDYYYPKTINLEAYEIPFRDKVYTPNLNNLLFVKRLTAAGAKMELYELFRSRSSSTDGTDQYDYYISFPGDNRLLAWNIRGPGFFPNFEEKMSKLVADCPVLAEKIKNKSGGYSVRQISVDVKKIEVIRKVVEEYNSCK